MRQIVLDTETTGLEVEQGHRIIEIGCVELLNRRLTGRRFHHYVNPEREIDAGAESVHGIRNEDLADKPRFAQIAAELREFLGTADLVIHNAAFDLGFLNAEMARLSAAPARLENERQIIDTLALARRLHPGQKNNLDALCRRYGVDNGHRELHGALLDAELLADVYLLMTGGQVALSFESSDQAERVSGAGAPRKLDATRPRLRVIAPDADERAAHAARLAAIAKRGRCLWPSTPPADESPPA